MEDQSNKRDALAREVLHLSRPGADAVAAFNKQTEPLRYERQKEIISQLEELELSGTTESRWRDGNGKTETPG